MEIFAKLGVDWKLLLAQAINFAVLFWVLRRYAYRPMLDFLEKRTERIEKGIQDAELAQDKLKEIEEKEKAVLRTAQSEARSIILSAEAAAKIRDDERMVETEAKAKRFLEEAELKIREEKEKAMLDAKTEIGEMVLLSLEKILREKVTPMKDKEIIEDRTR